MPPPDMGRETPDGAQPRTHPWGSCLAAWAPWHPLPSCGHSEPCLAPDPAEAKVTGQKVRARVLGGLGGAAEAPEQEGQGWAGVQDTHAEAGVEDWLEEVVQEAIQTP